MKEATTTAKPHFQEVQVLRSESYSEGKKIEKFETLKVLRPKVKITSAEAETLNAGVVEESANRIFSLYLLPGEDPKKFNREVVSKKG